MSLLTIFSAAAAVVTLATVTLHTIIIVNAFKRSSTWGVVCMLAPFASLIYAFTKLDLKGKFVLAGLFFGLFSAALILWIAVSFMAMNQFIHCDEKPNAQAVKEYEAAQNEIDSIENLDLGLTKPEKPKDLKK